MIEIPLKINCEEDFNELIGVLANYQDLFNKGIIKLLIKNG